MGGVSQPEPISRWVAPLHVESFDPSDFIDQMSATAGGPCQLETIEETSSQKRSAYEASCVDLVRPSQMLIG